MGKKKAETRAEFAKRFADAVMPSEENSFKGYFHKEILTPDQFASLMAGLDPQCYKKGRSLELSSKEYDKRARYATSILNRFLGDVDKGVWQKRYLGATEKEIYASTWRYIWWIAQRGIIPDKLFLNQLPLTLLELYLEFQPKDSALINAPKHTREHHEALYLSHARELIKEAGRPLPPTKIYKHPHMQNVQGYIRRELRGKYKKRTFVESWLPKLFKRSRGQPKKG